MNQAGPMGHWGNEYLYSGANIILLDDMSGRARRLTGPRRLFILLQCSIQLKD
jgi:hypothetical protein